MEIPFPSFQESKRKLIAYFSFPVAIQKGTPYILNVLSSRPENSEPVDHIKRREFWDLSKGNNRKVSSIAYLTLSIIL